MGRSKRVGSVRGVKATAAVARWPAGGQVRALGLRRFMFPHGYELPKLWARLR
jgi:hypothetical protein